MDDVVKRVSNADRAKIARQLSYVLDRAQFGHATDQEVQRAWDRLKEAMEHGMDCSNV